MISYNNWIRFDIDFNLDRQYWHYNYQKFSWTKIEDLNKLVTLVGQYDKKDNLINIFRNCKEASIKTNINRKNISAVCSKKRYSASGFVWKYLENQNIIPKNIIEIESELNKNIMKGYLKNNEIIYSIGKNTKIRHHRLVYFIYNNNKVSGCNICNKDSSKFHYIKTKHDIDHIDGNHSNNEPKNLQRLCKSCHATKTNYQTNNFKNKNNKNSIKIIVYKKDENISQKFNSITEASKKLHISQSSISNYFIKDNLWLKSRNNEYYRFEKIIDNIEKEIWKDIPGLNAKASNFGRIKDNLGRITYGTKSNNYYRISISNKYYSVNVLVLNAFKYQEKIEKAEEIHRTYSDITIEEILNSHSKKYSIECDHIDGNPENNNIENLRWTTKIENSNNKKTVKRIYQYLENGNLVQIFSNMKDASKKTGISYNGISRVCNNKQKLAGTFFWKKEN